MCAHTTAIAQLLDVPIPYTNNQIVDSWPDSYADSVQTAQPAFPGDVLTPDTRRNTPYLKIALRAGFNRSSYSNDRYLDNSLLDVGEVFGEERVYGSAAGVGYQAGLDVEYPLNAGLSVVFSGEYDHVTFGSTGNVQDVCASPSGDTVSHASLHEFDASIDYAKLGVTAKANFSSFYLLFGFTASHPVSSTLLQKRTSGGAPCFYPDPAQTRRFAGTGEIPDTSPLQFSMRLGVGLLYQLSERIQFSPELILDFGMSAINKSPESDVGVYGISAVLRYDI